MLTVFQDCPLPLRLAPRDLDAMTQDIWWWPVLHQWVSAQGPEAEPQVTDWWTAKHAKQLIGHSVTRATELGGWGTPSFKNLDFATVNFYLYNLIYIYIYLFKLYIYIYYLSFWLFLTAQVPLPSEKRAAFGQKVYSFQEPSLEVPAIAPLPHES